MSHIRRFDHVGITVADLDTVTEFFVGLGLEVEGRTFVEGEFVDTVIGIPGSRSQIVMLRSPEGGPGLERSSFVRPDHEPGSPTAMANELGLRNVHSKSTTCGRRSTSWLRTATAWSAASVSTRTSGAWPTFAGQRGSSFRWLSGSADGSWARFFDFRAGRMPRLLQTLAGHSQIAPRAEPPMPHDRDLD